MTETTNEKEILKEEEKELSKKYIQLESEEKNMETVIQCQTKRNEIQKQKEKITSRLYEITGKLLEENEEFKEEMNKATLDSNKKL